ncbi:unnamed protein product [Rhodiola kirilowii]
MSQRTNKKHQMAIGVWDCGSSLYDAFELVSFGHLLERRMMLLPNISGGSEVVDPMKMEAEHDQQLDSKILRKKIVVFSGFVGLMKSLGMFLGRMRNRKMFKRGKIGPHEF